MSWPDPDGFEGILKLARSSTHGSTVDRSEVESVAVETLRNSRPDATGHQEGEPEEERGGHQSRGRAVRRGVARGGRSHTPALARLTNTSNTRPREGRQGNPVRSRPAADKIG